MTLADLKVIVGPDGVLELRLPLGAESALREVRVIVGDAPPATLSEPSSDEDWRRFIAANAGSITDPSFVRQDQGEYEQREELFP